MSLIAGLCIASVGRGAALASASEVVALRAEAGLGGFARAGRWTPVRLEITNSNRDISGEVVVKWGDARLHRAVEIPAPSRIVLELYLRTVDVRGEMAVWLMAKGQQLAAVEVPIRLLPDEERLVVCVGAEAAGGSGMPSCATEVLPEALPRSMRGYAAAEEVRLRPGAESRLDGQQRTALQRWLAYRELEADDLLTLAPKAPLSASTAAGVPRSTTVAAAVVIAPFLCGAGIWMRRSGTTWRSYAALIGCSLAGVAGGMHAGRFGPGSAIVIRHASTIHQIEDAAAVSIRATVEFPAFASYALRTVGVDGDLTARSAIATEHWQDADGVPLRHGTFGRGAREEFEVEGMLEFAPFRVRREAADVVHVVNASDDTLTDCAFPAGFSERRAGTLAPGQSASARVVGPIETPFFSCALARPPVAFTESRYPVRMEGVAVVSVRLPMPLRDEGGAL